MRISDWSSDVCSSDLEKRAGNAPIARLLKARLMIAKGDLSSAVAALTTLTNDLPEFLPSRFLLGSALLAQGNLYQARSEERRVGKECVSTCRARWSQYH